MKFRKKPVVIEAHHFAPESDAEWLADWCGGRLSNYRSIVVDGFRTSSAPYIAIGTLEGEMRADVGDWIIRGVQGEFYPCKPDIFQATYEPAEAKR